MVWQVNAPVLQCITAECRPGSGIHTKMLKDTSYLRCTPLGHLFKDSKKRKAHVLLHSESKWVLLDTAGTQITVALIS